MAQGRNQIDTLVSELDISIGLAARSVAANRLQAQFDQGVEIGSIAVLALLRNANPEETADIGRAEINSIKDAHPEIFSLSASARTDISIDAGSIDLDTPAAFDAGDGAYNFLDDAAVSNNVVINNLSDDDRISFSNADVSDYAFANDGGDMRVSYNYNEEGTINVIRLAGVVDSDAVIYDHAGLAAAMGFDVFAV